MPNNSAPSLIISHNLLQVKCSKHLLALRPQIQHHCVEFNESFWFIDNWFQSDQQIRCNKLVLGPWDDKLEKGLEQNQSRANKSNNWDSVATSKIGRRDLQDRKTWMLQRQSRDELNCLLSNFQSPASTFSQQSSAKHHLTNLTASIVSVHADAAFLVYPHCYQLLFDIPATNCCASQRKEHQMESAKFRTSTLIRTSHLLSWSRTE